nr:hypothetical protein CFP56_15533 [Quercus suber]
MEPAVVFHPDMAKLLCGGGGGCGLGILTTCGWGCGCMAGYTFLLSRMDEEFSRFLGKQGKMSPLIVGAREEELVLYKG